MINHINYCLIKINHNQETKPSIISCQNHILLDYIINHKLNYLTKFQYILHLYKYNPYYQNYILLCCKLHHNIHYLVNSQDNLKVNLVLSKYYDKDNHLNHNYMPHYYILNYINYSQVFQMNIPYLNNDLYHYKVHYYLIYILN